MIRYILVSSLALLLCPSDAAAIFPSCLGQSHSRVCQNWHYISSTNPKNWATPFYNEFIAMANAHTITDRESIIESDLCDDDSPESTVTRWYSDHECSRLFIGSAHGNNLVCVELFEDANDRTTRLSALRTAGWRRPTPPTSEGFLANVTVDDAGHTRYGIALTLEAMRDSFPDMDGNGIGVLGWCYSGPAATHYLSHGAKAVFSSDNQCGPATAINLIVASLGCAFVFDDPSYGSTVGEAQRLLKAEGQNTNLKLNTSCELDMTCTNIRLSTTSCSKPAATFLQAGKTGAQVSWTAVEHNTEAYFICGFAEPGGTPDIVQRIEALPGGGAGRTVRYNEQVSESYPYWEVIEVEHGSTHRDYSGFFREGEQRGGIDDDGSTPPAIEENPAQLVANLEFTPVELTLEALDNEGGPVDVTQLPDDGQDDKTFRTYSTSAPCISCPSGLPTPDSTSCADYFVFSNSYAWSYEARDSIRTYTPGRGIISWAGPDPENAREGLRILICRNRQWNAWAAAHTPPITRRFPEALPLILVGSPGYFDHDEPDNLGGVIVAYDTLTAEDDLCFDGCVVDGKMASPWPDCPDSIAVPYTRIPATTLAELRTALRAAKEYSAGLYVDAGRRLVPIAGDVANNNAPSCDILSPVAEQTYNFMEYVRGVVGQQSHQTIRQSAGCPDRQNAVLSALTGASGGASLVVGVGHWSQGDWFPGIGEVSAVNLTKQQRIVSLLSCCNTANAIYSLSHRTDAEELMFNSSTKTQLAFLTGFTTGTSYDDDENWLLYLLAELENARGQSGFISWQDVVFRAQQSFGRDTGRWSVMQRVGNLGAPVRLPTELITGVPDPGVEAPINVAPRVFPNPARTGQACRIMFSLSAAATVSLDVLDITGRRVASIPEQEWEAGVHSLTWNGVADNGDKVSSGIYFGRLTAGATTRVVRIVRVNKHLPLCGVDSEFVPVLQFESVAARNQRKRSL